MPTLPTQRFDEQPEVLVTTPRVIPGGFSGIETLPQANPLGFVSGLFRGQLVPDQPAVLMNPPLLDPPPPIDQPEVEVTAPRGGNAPPPPILSPPTITTDPFTGIQTVFVGGARPRPAPAPRRAPPRRSPPKKPPPRRRPARRTSPGRARPGGPNLLPFRFVGLPSLLILLANKAYQALSNISAERIRQLIGAGGSDGSGGGEFPIELEEVYPEFGQRRDVEPFGPLEEVNVTAPRLVRDVITLPSAPFGLPFAPPSPFAPPLASPLAPPRPNAPPVSLPFAPPVPTPTPLIDPFPLLSPFAPPSTLPFSNPSPLIPPGLTPFQAPGVDSFPTPQQAGCNCPKPERKKKKPKEPRKVCYRGTYYENSKSLSKFRKERIPCQRSKSKPA